MNKKLTSALGIALGASLLAGFGIYKLLSNRGERTKPDGGSGAAGNSLFGSYLDNGLTKSNSLYEGGHGSADLIGGGLYKTSGHSFVGNSLIADGHEVGNG